MKIVIIIILMLFAICGCEKAPTENSKPSSHDNHEIKIKEHKKQLAEKHNAVQDWNPLYKDGEVIPEIAIAPVYTYKIKESLIRQDKRPILFTGNVYDITKEDGRYVILFRALYGSMGVGVDVIFELDCTDQQFAYINENLKDKEGLWGFDGFIGVANVSEVKRLFIEISASSNSYSETVRINNESSKTFIAKGQCIDVIYLESD